MPHREIRSRIHFGGASVARNQRNPIELVRFHQIRAIVPVWEPCAFTSLALVTAGQIHIQPANFSPSNRSNTNVIHQMSRLIILAGFLFLFVMSCFLLDFGLLLFQRVCTQRARQHQNECRYPCPVARNTHAEQTDRANNNKSTRHSNYLKSFKVHFVKLSSAVLNNICALHVLHFACFEVRVLCYGS